MKYYDITAVFSEELPVYKGDPPVSIEPYYDMSRGDVCNVSVLRFGTHTGTHADVPRHFVAGGTALDEMPLDYFMGKAKLFDLTEALKEGHCIQPSHLANLPIGKGDIVLFKTPNAARMLDSVFYEDFIYFSPEAALYLAEKGVKTVGIDYLSVERYGAPEPPTHRAFLENGVVCLEGLLLVDVPAGSYTLVALPLKIKGGGNGSPVRAVLMSDNTWGE